MAMKKVKLLPEDLQVESFEVEPDFQGIGTVKGFETVHTECYTHCPGGGCEDPNSVVQTHCNYECPSWDGGCYTVGGGYTCGYTCDGGYTCYDPSCNDNSCYYTCYGAPSCYNTCVDDMTCGRICGV
jgi:hypothetical protein